MIRSLYIYVLRKKSKSAQWNFLKGKDLLSEVAMVDSSPPFYYTHGFAVFFKEESDSTSYL